MTLQKIFKRIQQRSMKSSAAVEEALASNKLKQAANSFMAAIGKKAASAVFSFNDELLWEAG